MNPTLLKKIQEDKRRRERLLLKQKMSQAVDLLEDNEVNISDVREKSIFTIYWEKLLDLVEDLKPFRKQMRTIKNNYDRSISLFFQILQSVFVYTMLSCLIYSYMVIGHYLKYDNFPLYYGGTVGGIFPAIYFYSRFQPGVKKLFAIT